MKKDLGQYFTKSEYLLKSLFQLIQNKNGYVLEPSCGAGHIVEYLLKHRDNRHIDCYEIDSTIQFLSVFDSHPDLINLNITDFLNHNFETKKYATIVGNPPYVKRKLERNIYIDFIDKCIDLLENNGELIFIIPSDFFLLTSASDVKKKMMENGNITHIIRPNKESLFDNASQDIMIIRYQKDAPHNQATLYNNEKRKPVFENGNVYFIKEDDTTIHLKDVFDIKVGMVSGADNIFKNDDLGNVFVKTNNGNMKFIFPPDDFHKCDDKLKQYLEQNKEKLSQRKITKITDANWYKWGCLRNIRFMEENKDKLCIYCATITRKTPVFHIDKVKYFDGSLLCLYPKNSAINLDKLLDYLNTEDFLENFKFAGRYKLGQKSLADMVLPKILLEATNNNS